MILISSTVFCERVIVLHKQYVSDMEYEDHSEHLEAE